MSNFKSIIRETLLDKSSYIPKKVKQEFDISQLNIKSPFEAKMINIKREVISNMMKLDENKYSSNSTIMRKLVSCVPTNNNINKDKTVNKNIKAH